MTTEPSLYQALAAFQASLPPIPKDQTAKAGTFSYKYADLAAVSAVVLPRLGKLGLSFSCQPTLKEGTLVLAYELTHTSGYSISGLYPLPQGGTPQALGSAITYGRRYCLCAVVGVAPDEDDDGAAATRTQDPWTEQQRAETQGVRAAPARSRGPVERATGVRPVTTVPLPEPGDDEDSLGTWADAIGDLTSAEDAAQLTREARDLFKQGGLSPGKVNKILAAIKDRKGQLEGAAQ